MKSFKEYLDSNEKKESTSPKRSEKQVDEKKSLTLERYFVEELQTMQRKIRVKTFRI